MIRPSVTTNDQMAMVRSGLVADPERRLTADVHWLDGQVAELAEGTDQHPGDVAGAVDRAGEAALAAAVAGEGGVRCEEVDEGVELTVLGGRDETPHQFVAFSGRRVVTRSIVGNPTTRADGKLAAGGRGLRDDPGDVVVRVAEDVAEQEDRALVG